MPSPNRFLLTAKNLLALAVFIVCLAVIYGVLLAFVMAILLALML